MKEGGEVVCEMKDIVKDPKKMISLEIVVGGNVRQ